MPDTRLSIRLDLTSGDRIGPGKIALLEAIQATGSISAAARSLGMSYRRAWLLVEQINDSLQQPAVTAATGGRQGGGAALTPSGERVIALYRSIEDIARSSAKEEFRAVGKLVRKGRAARAWGTAPRRADVLLFPIDCISHDAVATLKRLCRQLEKPYLPLRAASLATLASSLAGINRGP
jgi:molybdate transport system regulatory protein